MVDLGLEWKQTEVTAQFPLRSLAESHRTLGQVGAQPGAFPSVMPELQECTHQRAQWAKAHRNHSPVVGAGLGPSGPHREQKLLSWAGPGNQLRLQPGQRIEQLGLSPTHAVSMLLPRGSRAPFPCGGGARTGPHEAPPSAPASPQSPPGPTAALLLKGETNS